MTEEEGVEWEVGGELAGREVAGREVAESDR